MRCLRSRSQLPRIWRVLDEPRTSSARSRSACLCALSPSEGASSKARQVWPSLCGNGSDRFDAAVLTFIAEGAG